MLYADMLINTLSDLIIVKFLHLLSTILIDVNL